MTGSHSAIHHQHVLKQFLYFGNSPVLFDDSTNDDAATRDILRLAKSGAFALEFFRQRPS